MTTERDRDSVIDTFVERLYALSKEAGSCADLAKLKRCAGRPLSDSPRAFPVFYGILPAMLRGDEGAEDRLFLCATLYAQNPRQAADGNLGTALARLADSRGDGRDGVDRRFAALLDADVQALPFRLRQLVSLLDSAEIGVNWRSLSQDLLWWDHPQHRVQRTWARSYFGGSHLKENSMVQSAGPNAGE